jgi:hypothetical protein
MNATENTRRHIATASAGACVNRMRGPAQLTARTAMSKTNPGGGIGLARVKGVDFRCARAASSFIRDNIRGTPRQNRRGAFSTTRYTASNRNTTANSARSARVFRRWFTRAPTGAMNVDASRIGKAAATCT